MGDIGRGCGFYMHLEPTEPNRGFLCNYSRLVSRPLHRCSIRCSKIHCHSCSTTLSQTVCPHGDLRLCPIVNTQLASIAFIRTWLSGTSQFWTLSLNDVNIVMASLNYMVTTWQSSIQPFHRMCHTAGMAGQRTHASHLASISIISDVVVVLVAVSDVVEDCIKRVTPAH